MRKRGKAAMGKREGNICTHKREKGMKKKTEKKISI